MVGRSGEWKQYRVQAVLDPTLVATRETRPINTKFESAIFRLRAPIVSRTAEISSIISTTYRGQPYRLYPPFPINPKDGIKGEFSNVWIPEGEELVDFYATLPSHAVRAAEVRPENNNIRLGDDKYCYGLRVDAPSASRDVEFLDYVVNVIAFYTHQWWLVASQSPFDSPIRMYATLVEPSRLPYDPLPQRDGKVVSGWFAAAGLQAPFGIELSLNQRIWRDCAHHIQNQWPIDVGVNRFHRALSDLLNGRLEDFVLNCCICFEIVGNKQRKIDKKKPLEIDKLLREMRYPTSADQDVAKKMIVDRGHVAHGRDLYHLAKDPGLKKAYVETIARIVDAYIRDFPLDQAAAVMGMSINRK